MTLMQRRRTLILNQCKNVTENFVRIGNPTIVNGVMTPSADSWITTPDVFSPGSNPWELVFRIKRTSVNGFQNIIQASGILLQGSTTYIKLFLRSQDSATYDICNGSEQRSIPAGALLYVRLKFDGNSYSYGVSSDGITYNEMSVSSSSIIRAGVISFGSKASNTVAVSADYYLHDAFIKINNDLWWKPYT